jgi:hypothetical protein
MEIETILRRLLIGLFCFLTSLSIASAYKSGESHMSHFNTGIQDRVSSEAMFHNYFVDKGFMNGKIKIPELAVEVNLGKNQFFKKEEKVADLCVRIKEIRKQFGLSNHDSDCVQGYGWCGFLQAECQGEEAYGYVILIKKDLNEVSRIYTIGHENGHFLWYSGNQKIIYQRFKNSDFIQKQIHTDCEFAVLCGWIAVKTAEYNLNDCLMINVKDPETERKSDFLKNLVRDYLLKN